jgi:hypothetical protein
LRRLPSGRSDAILIIPRHVAAMEVGLWTVGVIFAVVIANYWIADEIYPFIR